MLDYVRVINFRIIIIITYHFKFLTFRHSGAQNVRMSEMTRGSAIAEEPRDALRQLKYYGRF